MSKKASPICYYCTNLRVSGRPPVRFPGAELGQQHPEAQHHRPVARHEAELPEPRAGHAAPPRVRNVLGRRLQIKQVVTYMTCNLISDNMYRTFRMNDLTKKSTVIMSNNRTLDPNPNFSFSSVTQKAT